MRKLFLLLWGVVFFATQALAQRTISGKVTNDKGAPLQNVSVMVRGTTTGTITKADGTYSLIVPANAKALVFSAVDMSPVEMAIGASTTIDASLKNEDKTMSEVVVTAFGIKKNKKDLGYGVTQLSGTELTQAHTTNISNAIASKIPGVRVSGAGGSFTGSSILIRGYTTFTGSNQPLFVVDGIPIDNSGGAFAIQTGVPRSNRAIDLNQDDIESITVLKGASAAVLYGSRAANGVILITMKKGKVGQKGVIQYSTTYQIESVNRFPSLQNEYAQGAGGVFSASTQNSWGPRITGQTVTTAFNPATGLSNKTEVLQAYPNNVRDIFKQGMNWQNNISFSGGSDRNSFRFSYGYLKNKGVIENNELIRHNFSLNVSSKINNYLTVTVSGNYSNNASRRTQQGNQLSNPVFKAWFVPRTYDINQPYEDALGNQRYLNQVTGVEDHPFWTIKNNRYRDEINRFIGSVSLNFRITKWLQADYKVGSDIYSVFQHAYDQIGARGQANTNAGGAGAVRETRNNYRSLGSNGYFTANKRVKNWSGTLIAGTEFNQVYSNASQMDGKGVIVRDFEQLSNTTTFSPAPSFGSSKTRLLALYGDLSISFKSVFSISGTIRNDWSSTFKIGNNSYLYNGIGASLNITEMFPKLKGKIIESIKIRGNVASVGKAGDFIYGTDSYFGGAGSADGFGPSITYPFNSIQAFTLSNAAGDPKLGPEFTKNREIAAELSFFKNRLTIEVTRYKQTSRNLIFSAGVSATTGITSQIRNAGSLTNNGVELGVGIMPIKSKSFNWNINLAYTQFKAIVNSLAQGLTNISISGFVTPNTRLVVGEEYGLIYGTAYVRDPSKGNKMVVGLNGLPLATATNVRIGNANPKYVLGITNTMTFNALSISFLMEYKEGGDLYSRNIRDIQSNGVGKETAEFPRYDAAGVLQRPYLFDAVYANGQPNTTFVSAEQYYGNSGKFVAAEGFIFKTSWFRIREASVSYTLPADFLRRTPFSNASLNVFGRNLYMHTPFYPHLDPEQNVQGIANAGGIEFNALPQTRTVGVGLNLSF